MGKLLRWVVHTLEIFMWEDDYQLGSDDPVFDISNPELLSEYWPENLEDDDEADLDNPEPGEVRWHVKIEYADESTQEIVSYQDYLFDKPSELFSALLEYFDADDLDERETP